jgi:RimJ/RimL family protein N-acetyltransferase
MALPYLGMMLPDLRTTRLLLRPWRSEDRDALAAMNADPRVMEYFPKTMTLEESQAMFDRFHAHVDEHGFGIWAVEIPGVAACAGFLGLWRPKFVTRFTPCVEMGWRLAAAHWNRGYATEGAKAAMTYGFESLGLDELVAFTAVENVRSRRVMEKLGMTWNPADDFDHPNMPEGHPVRRQVLYRKKAAEARGS